MSSINHSPFRYPGGKFYARKHILSFIPKHRSYIEPFAGGASVFFAKSTAPFRNILNDLDKDLINCYEVIRDHVDDLINGLSGLKASKETHTYFKTSYCPTNAVEHAVKYFYLNRTSYSGIMHPSGCYWGYGDKYSMRPERWPDHLRSVSAKIQGVEFSSKDFSECIDLVDDSFFAFIDPPYFNADQDKFYRCSFSKTDHYRLATILEDCQNSFPFLLTYDDSPEIRDLYGWARITERQWTYTIARTDDQKRGLGLSDNYKGRRQKGREIFITNYHIDFDSELFHIHDDYSLPVSDG